ncbi:MAG: hypothetical protein QOG64_2979 [Acidimicrobiaceae bacterium]|nr:hypothetical protein [Acidimicrobiaceae bacterium]
MSACSEQAQPGPLRPRLREIRASPSYGVGSGKLPP